MYLLSLIDKWLHGEDLAMWDYSIANTSVLLEYQKIEFSKDQQRVKNQGTTFRLA